MGVIVYTLYSFAKDNKGGNLAGVVLDADHLSDIQMLNIANQVGFSETAFVHKSNKATFKVRFFTPNSEVDLCGHATIATFSLLRNRGLIGSGIFSQETKAGILNITVDHDSVYMNQILPKYYDILDKAEIADSLNLSSNDCLNNLPAQIVSTGLKDVIVAVKSIKILSSIQPDFAKISELSKKYNVIGYHVFSLETKFGSTAHCRNFAPLYDIKEESATGTSNGALACYLHNYGVINKDQSSELLFEQGYSIGKPSEILVRLKIKKDKISEVLVGGTALIRDELTFEQL
ncbi:PhzF family phenazine biosynthesis protein [Sporomusaceae bacterium BoRhaA]|uniref:PhzF family phenazine biosynthesis protein n=1 Tax=Pelorhabdus rhamnosifermentans TaxID=2772457 RepID=UPI001C06252B|nr:PhzF family phenazine biosynthesis protein [Pelorhabdus rhamnosifermentans]MBU2700124.1 PhzF family phenazine biosynthesis protein [Pelorhabdus rhamnosifermentans]